MLAANKGQQEVVRILLAHGADINSKFLLLFKGTRPILISVLNNYNPLNMLDQLALILSYSLEMQYIF